MMTSALQKPFLDESCQYNHYRPVPDLKTAIHEIVTKDMSRTGTWMELRFDIETIGVDMGEAILQEFMEDTILSYVDGSPKSENALVIAESNEKDGILNL
ncbi:hypothetical protein CerSpe_018380 [Prunus speciosa]